MAVNYYLRQNKLGKDGKTYMANVISRGTFEHDYIIEVMLTRGSTVTRADILSVLSDYHDTIESFLQNGYNVKTPLANFSSSIRGIFNDYGEYYQEGRHKIYPVINPGKRLLRFYRERMKAHIVRPNQNIPRLNSFTDIVSGSKSKWITPGSMAEITGSLLKIDKESDTSGIFFINQKHERIKVDCYRYEYAITVIIYDTG